MAGTLLFDVLYRIGRGLDEQRVGIGMEGEVDNGTCRNDGDSFILLLLNNPVLWCRGHISCQFIRIPRIGSMCRRMLPSGRIPFVWTALGGPCHTVDVHYTFPSLPDTGTAAYMG